MKADAETQQEMAAMLRTDLGKEPIAFLKLKGGRNSQVYKVDCSDGSAIAVKCYFRSASDQRDRMGCEFHALRFLESGGIKQVATPLAADKGLGIAAYEFIHGERVTSADVGDAEIDELVDLLRVLKGLAATASDAGLPPASEACFSIDAIFASVDRRATALTDAAANEPALAEYMHHDFEPFRRAIEPWCRDFCRANHIDPNAEIPLTARTLSPSDFGFHNTLRAFDGKLAFLDFEYFGWDDPAKTISDFLLHPAMELSHNLQQRFVTGALSAFADVPQLGARVRAVYPLFGLKWCTILLNEFTLDHMARRRFADAASGVWSQALQLKKARRTLAQTKDDYRDFPYHT